MIRPKFSLFPKNQFFFQNFTFLVVDKEGNYLAQIYTNTFFFQNFYFPSSGHCSSVGFTRRETIRPKFSLCPIKVSISSNLHKSRSTFCQLKFKNLSQQVQKYNWMCSWKNILNNKSCAAQFNPQTVGQGDAMKLNIFTWIDLFKHVDRGWTSAPNSGWHPLIYKASAHQ